MQPNTKKLTPEKKRGLMTLYAWICVLSVKGVWSIKTNSPPHIFYLTDDIIILCKRTIIHEEYTFMTASTLNDIRWFYERRLDSSYYTKDGNLKTIYTPEGHVIN